MSVVDCNDKVTDISSDDALELADSSLYKLFLRLGWSRMPFEPYVWLAPYTCVADSEKDTETQRHRDTESVCTYLPNLRRPVGEFVLCGARLRIHVIRLTSRT